MVERFREKGDDLLRCTLFPLYVRSEGEWNHNLTPVYTWGFFTFYLSGSTLITTCYQIGTSNPLNTTTLLCRELWTWRDKTQPLTKPPLVAIYQTLHLTTCTCRCLPQRIIQVWSFSLLQHKHGKIITWRLFVLKTIISSSRRYKDQLLNSFPDFLPLGGRFTSALSIYKFSFVITIIAASISETIK